MTELTVNLITGPVELKGNLTTDNLRELARKLVIIADQLDDGDYMHVRESCPASR